MENKYERGKIYKLVNEEFPDLVYYGSTIKKLSRRLTNHRADSKIKNNSSKILFSKGECKIILIENYPCKSNLELFKKERQYIENNDCINKCIPSRTNKEWMKANKDKMREWHKKYREENREKVNQWARDYKSKNREKINEIQKEKIICPICNISMTKRGINRHEKTQKHINNTKNK